MLQKVESLKMWDGSKWVLVQILDLNQLMYEDSIDSLTLTDAVSVTLPGENFYDVGDEIPTITIGSDHVMIHMNDVELDIPLQVNEQDSITLKAISDAASVLANIENVQATTDTVSLLGVADSATITVN